MAMALILLAFLAIEPITAEFPLIWRMLSGPDGAAARHGELIGNQMDQVTAATL